MMRKRKPLILPNYIDIKAVHIHFKYMSTDGNGNTFLYEKKPCWSEYMSLWFASSGTFETVKAFSSFRRGTVTPENSLMDLDELRRERGLL